MKAAMIVLVLILPCMVLSGCATHVQPYAMCAECDNMCECTIQESPDPSDSGALLKAIAIQVVLVSVFVWLAFNVQGS